MEEQNKRRGPGQGRPAIGPVVKTSIPEDMIERIDAEAKRRGVKRADVLREMILDGTSRLPAPCMVDTTM